MTNKNMIDKNIIVTGIKFRDWTITAKVTLTFEYEISTNKFHHKQSSIGVNDGDIVGYGNNASIPNISFSNHVTVDAVRWAKMTADAGMDIGQRNDWIDAIYESDALRDAIADEAAYMSADVWYCEEPRLGLLQGGSQVSKKDSVKQELVRLIQMCGGGETDNDGQIVIYTGMMYDEDDNIVPFVCPDEDSE